MVFKRESLIGTNNAARLKVKNKAVGDARQQFALLPGGAEGGHEVHGDRSGVRQSAPRADRAQARSRRSMKRPAKIAPPTQLLWRKALKQSARSRARIRV